MIATLYGERKLPDGAMRWDAPAKRGARIREIEVADLPQMTRLFTGKFGYPANAYTWLFDTLASHRTPDGMPQYGYLLEARGRIVGGIILVSTMVPSDKGAQVRCHLTSLYVEPEFRGLGAFLMMKAKSKPGVTYVNLSALPASRAIIEAQGFEKYSSGQFIAVPLMTALRPPSTLRVLGAGAPLRSASEPFERKIMADHARYGCICVWCETGERAHPFVFQPKMVKRAIPAAQLVYCRDVADAARFAKPIGAALAKAGRFLMVIDSNGPIKGLPGYYFEGVYPRWYKGIKPRLGDLAYTLPAMCGPFK
jgi:GNAT superfamily N-acetyltransferase